MLRGTRRNEEKGLRTVRNPDAYLPKRGLKDGSLCRGCGVIYRDKRWQNSNPGEISAEVLCPACQRTGDNNPGGVVILSGSHLAAHKDEILHTINNEESRSREKNPIGRIMNINESGGRITITTTESKLAQKLGREVYKSQRGELHYHWSHEQNLVRVEWSR